MKQFVVAIAGAVFSSAVAWAQPPATATNTIANLTLSCFVDTPAFDQYVSGSCASTVLGGPQTTTAVFKVFGTASGHSYSYSWTGCTSSSSECQRIIRAYQPITVSVVVTDTSTGEQQFLSAQAEYELGF